MDGFAQPQRARLVALPSYTGSTVRPAFEVDVENVAGGSALAYVMDVDAVNGRILFRHDAVTDNAQATSFTGTFAPPPAPACGVNGPYIVDGATKSIDVTATAGQPENDILLELDHPLGTAVSSSDVGTSPEAIHYAPGVLAPGDYYVKVCPSSAPAGPFVAPYTYVGTFSSSDVSNPAVPYPPQWKFFTNAPNLDYSGTDTRTSGCWVTQVGGTPVPGCDLKLENQAARSPWDFSVQLDAPTFTTTGNAATTAEAWVSPLTPGGTFAKPVDVDRTYGYGGTPSEDWTNQWFTSKCDPASLAPPQRNDVLAAVTNLFAGHNRFHDWSYRLGFTEANYNLQQDNFGAGRR